MLSNLPFYAALNVKVRFFYFILFWRNTLPIFQTVAGREKTKNCIEN